VHHLDTVLILDSDLFEAGMAFGTVDKSHDITPQRRGCTLFTGSCSDAPAQ
jgi:hypothetical protein